MDLVFMGIARFKIKGTLFSCWWDATDRSVTVINLEESGTWPLEHFHQHFVKAPAK